MAEIKIMKVMGDFSFILFIKHKIRIRINILKCLVFFYWKTFQNWVQNKNLDSYLLSTSDFSATVLNLIKISIIYRCFLSSKFKKQYERSQPPQWPTLYWLTTVVAPLSFFNAKTLLIDIVLNSSMLNIYFVTH